MASKVSTINMKYLDCMQQHWYLLTLDVMTIALQCILLGCDQVDLHDVYIKVSCTDHAIDQICSTLPI